MTKLPFDRTIAGPAGRPSGAKVKGDPSPDVAPPVFGRGSVSITCLHNGVQLHPGDAKALAVAIERGLQSFSYEIKVAAHVCRVLRGEPEMETLVETIEDTCARRDQNGRPVARG